MNKQIVVILSILITLIALKLAVQPYIQHRSANRVVKSVLNYWQSGDLLSAIDYWKDPQQTPPIYNLTSYEITKKEFSKENKTDYAKIYVDADFATEGLLPSGKEWVFRLEKTRYGWKIIGFHPVR